ncbi:hypothetical protein ACOTJB_27665 [Achromobacter xylosoxidans]
MTRFPRRDAMLALPEENRGKACVAKKNAAMKAASFRCGGARGNLAARNKDLNNLAGTWLHKFGVVG